MTKSLYFGSSLTNAFWDWHQEEGQEERSQNADFLMCHGAFFLPSALQQSLAYERNGSLFRFPLRFDIRDDAGDLHQEQFYGDGVAKFRDGDGLAFDIKQYDTLVFTSSQLFWAYSYQRLFTKGFGLLTEDSKALFQQAELRYPISKDAFLALHQDLFGIAYDFLSAARCCHPELKILVAPAVLPPKAQSYLPPVWRQLHSMEMELVFQEQQKLFSTLPMRQPIQTLSAEFETLQTYMADDLHHYNAAFVELLNQQYDF
ncbi:hypothetical protein ACTL6U_05720 [Rhodovibrionaceae bacterium A322]